MGITLYTRWPLWVRGKATAAFDIKNRNSMTSQKSRGGSAELCTIWTLPEINNKKRKRQSWAGKEVGTKTMWVPLAQGAFIYGTHMTRNITANNTTNTCTFPQHPTALPKKISNKCHTNQSEVAKPLNKQTDKLLGSGRESSTRKYPHSSHVLFLSAVCFVVLPLCAWRVPEIVIFPACCRRRASSRARKKLAVDRLKV